MNSRQNKRQKNRQKKREKPKRLAGNKRRENRKRTEKREKVSAIGRLTREMMSDVMETALKNLSRQASSENAPWSRPGDVRQDMFTDWWSLMPVLWNI